MATDMFSTNWVVVPLAGTALVGLISQDIHPYRTPALTLAVSKTFLYFILEAIYNVLFHPLRNIPGPRSTAASRLSYTLARVRGRATHRSKDLHDKYGHVVRIAPDILSFTTSQAWAGQSPVVARSFVCLVRSLTNS